MGSITAAARPASGPPAPQKPSSNSPKTIPNPPKNHGLEPARLSPVGERYRGGPGVRSSRSRGAGGRAQRLGALPGPSGARGGGGWGQSPEDPLTQVPAFCGAGSRPRSGPVRGDAALTSKGELRHCSAGERCRAGLPDPPKAAQQPGACGDTARETRRGAGASRS